MTTERGFTLIEMAIVLVIVTILIGGLVMPLSAQIQARRIGETKKTLEDAREALLGYAMTTPSAAAAEKRLPCPDTDGDGVSEPFVGGVCPQNAGWFPWVTLGAAAQDAWGNRLRYAVLSEFSSEAGFSAATALPSAPFGICTTHGCTTPDVAADVVFVLVSHGANGWGGRNVSGATLTAPTGLDEADNLDANRTYISRTPSLPGAAAGEFDDLVSWVSFPQLVSKICPTGSSCHPSPGV